MVSMSVDPGVKYNIVIDRLIIVNTKTVIKYFICVSGANTCFTIMTSLSFSISTMYLAMSF